MDPATIILLLVVAVVVIFVVKRLGGPKPLPGATEEPGAEAESDGKALDAPADGDEEAEAPDAAPEGDADAEASAPAAAPADDEAAAPAEEAAPSESDDAAASEAADAEAPAEEAAASPEPAPAAAPAEPSEEERAEKRKARLEAYRKGLSQTRGGFVSKLSKLFGRKKAIDPDILEEAEEILLTADIGVQTADAMLTELKERLERNELADGDAVFDALRVHAEAILDGAEKGAFKDQASPTVILVVGVNGVGKTTTIGKLAARYVEQGRKVVLAAGDTFRAAAVLQLEMWGRRTKCEVIKGKDRADPGSVIYDAVEKGVADGADVIICDTAGRLHTKTPLMDELAKVGRSAEKALGRPVDEILLVLDATTGQNAIQQAAMFKEALPVSGLVLTKLDGTAKGGVVLGIVDQHQIPVRFIGVGERMEDLRSFDPEPFVEALFERPEASEDEDGDA